MRHLPFLPISLPISLLFSPSYFSSPFLPISLPLHFSFLRIIFFFFLLVNKSQKSQFPQIRWVIANARDTWKRICCKKSMNIKESSAKVFMLKIFAKNFCLFRLIEFWLFIETFFFINRFKILQNCFEIFSKSLQNFFKIASKFLVLKFWTNFDFFCLNKKKFYSFFSQTFLLHTKIFYFTRF